MSYHQNVFIFSWKEVAVSAPVPGPDKLEGVSLNGRSASSSNSTLADMPKKRPAPQPPMGASQSVPSSLSTCHLRGQVCWHWGTQMDIDNEDIAKEKNANCHYFLAEVCRVHPEKYQAARPTPSLSKHPPEAAGRLGGQRYNLHW